MVTRHIDFFNPHKIALSGQAFRINIIDDTHVELVAYGRYLQIANIGKNEFAFSCNDNEFNSIWHSYFDLDRDYNKIVHRIDPNDSYLIEAAKHSEGIRILQQERFETLISFIISQRRSIPSIKTSVERLSEFYGAMITPPVMDKPFVNPLQSKYHAFPTSFDLKDLTLEDITELGVGYRAPYIHDVIESINRSEINLDEYSIRNSSDLLDVLLSIRGVGLKVANCIMLFSYARVEQFPIDVWIKRIIDRYYNGKFDTAPYKDCAGIIQQFMFYYEREQSRKL